MKLITYYLLIIVFSLNSCYYSTDNKLEDISQNCFCSLDYKMNRTSSSREGKSANYEFTYKGVPFFDLGVSRRAFANSQVINICNKWDLDEFSNVKINIVKDTIDDTVNFTTVEYKVNEISNYIDDYNSIQFFLNEFIDNIYSENYTKCYEQTLLDIELDEFTSILKSAKQNLFPRYKSTIIVGYDIDESESKEYIVSGGILAKSNSIWLFGTLIKKVENEYKIISINFS